MNSKRHTFQVQHSTFNTDRKQKNNPKQCTLFRHSFNSSMKQNWSRIHCNYYYITVTITVPHRLCRHCRIKCFFFWIWIFYISFQRVLRQKDRETKSKWQWNWKYVPHYFIYRQKCWMWNAHTHLHTKCNQNIWNGKYHNGICLFASHKSVFSLFLLPSFCFGLFFHSSFVRTNEKKLYNNM